MNDDFNTPILISHLFEAVKFINSREGEDSQLLEKDLDAFKSLFEAFVFDVLGLQEGESKEDNNKLDQVIQMLISMRANARADKNWTLSDQLRDQLAGLGIILKDGKDGTDYTIE